MGAVSRHDQASPLRASRQVEGLMTPILLEEQHRVTRTFVVHFRHRQDESRQVKLFCLARHRAAIIAADIRFRPMIMRSGEPLINIYTMTPTRAPGRERR